MTDDLALLEAQQDVHELIARQAPLDNTLDAIAGWAGILLPGASAAFMRFDQARCTLSLLPSQRFSKRYCERLQQVGIGPNAPSFGAAGYWRRPMVTVNIVSDARWHDLRRDALDEGLQACWSCPVLNASGELLGTFDAYFRESAAPAESSLQWLRQGAALVALAIMRDQESRSHRALAEWYRSLFDNHPEGVYEFDLEGRFQRGNTALERISGYAEEALVGRHFNDFIDPEYRELTQDAFDAARSGETRHYETAGIHANGHVYHLEITNFPVTIDEDVVGVYGICRDITQRKHQESDLRLLQRGIEASPVGVIMADATQEDMPLVYANDAFCRITGHEFSQVIGRNCRFLQGSETAPASIDTIRDALRRCSAVEVTLLNYRQDGSTFWNNLSISPVVDETGKCTHFIGTLEDITQQLEQEAQLAYQASHDVLTGLANRSALDGRLESEFRSSREQRHTLVVMYLDLDGFRVINDGLGHHVGNLLLAAVADRLRLLLGASDTLARIASDEFVMLFPGFENRNEVTDKAQSILDAFDMPIEIAGRELYISTSIGVAYTDAGTVCSQELLQNAGLALEEAKRQGRNTWQWYKEGVRQRINARCLLRHDMQVALREQQFELYYQPIVEAFSGRIRSVEALVRWQHPEHGLISPAEFIPLAEQTGQIITLGRWVLRHACQSMADRLAQGERVFPVSVNISPLQFRRDGFLDEVTRILDETQLPPELLELEVTESILMRGAEQAIALIGKLRERGITIAIDDFGTGFSSLSYLRDLPIHRVKLDRAFIQDILTCSGNAAIVQGIITMAHHMNLQVVAEGIETFDQQRDLGRRQCDLLQGFLFAKPMPLDRLQALPDRLPEATGQATGREYRSGVYGLANWQAI
ncbi:EAL domain-containing protein [Halomonas sabkhae]|uniref:sensor domain-containing phosphodiesterase n=1 Tax=Halomonas sabkhae TaxID=626223 RepID=UPI0025B599A0|nr:EAL domain-containing protein [Halomonas sabkhae]MDN3524873.1 EAL domain-containing protein [Halomonas sabkhae]